MSQLTTITAGDPLPVRLTFKDEAGVPATPSIAKYSVRDVTTDAILVTETSISGIVNGVVTLTLDAAAVAMHSTDLAIATERHLLVVISQNAAGQPLTRGWRFQVARDPVEQENCGCEE